MRTIHHRPPLPGVGGGAPTWWTRWLLAGLLGLLGAGIGLEVGGQVVREVGPFEVELSTHLGWRGESTLSIPPLGKMHLDTHDGPLVLRAELLGLQPEETRELAGEPRRLATVGDQVQDDLRTAVEDLVVKAILWTLTGAVLLPMVLLRRGRESAVGLLMGALLITSVGSTAWMSRNPQALSEPRYEGLLSSAPAVVGNAEDVLGRFDAYSTQLAELVENVTTLYGAASQLPVESGGATLEVLHVSDIHSNPATWKQITQIVRQFGVEVVVDSGDLTDRGAEAEAVIFSPIQELPVPYVYVRGNHDSAETVAQLDAIPNVTILDGVVEIAGLHFLGSPDPRFTPDVSNRDRVAERQAVEEQGEALREAAAESDVPVDLIVVHDPIAANEVGGSAPLVLSGHAHKRARYLLEESRIFVEGSSGAAGLRGLEGDEPMLATMTILHLDAETKELVAWDDITLGGLGTSTVTIDRHLLETPQDTFEEVEKLPGTDGPPGRGQPPGIDRPRHVPPVDRRGDVPGEPTAVPTPR